MSEKEENIDIYTEKEIDELISFYSDKIIKQDFGDNYPYRIERFEATKIKVKFIAEIISQSKIVELIKRSRLISVDQPCSSELKNLTVSFGCLSNKDLSFSQQGLNSSINSSNNLFLETESDFNFDINKN